jgi:hypothetical protein
VVLSMTATAQSGNTQGFRWDWKNAHELSLKQTVNSSHELSDTERRKLLEAIIQRLKMAMETDANPAVLAANTRVKFIDLNGDGTPEIIAQPVGLGSGCGATGNCPFWIFEKTTESYKLILGAEVFQVFTVESTVTNGFRDIVLGSHDSASQRTLSVFRYSNGKYRQRECYIAEFYDSSNHLRREPTISPCPK